jgi:chloramphenicol O-acetyltransferase type A
MEPQKTKVDLANYARRDLLQAFQHRQIPFFSTTCQIDITQFKRLAGAQGHGFFIPMSYLISRAVNAVPALRQRIIGGDLYEFDRVDPGYTVLLEDDTFSFCDSRHFESYGAYREHAARCIAAVKQSPDRSTGDKDHMFFITSVPWFSFTAFTHPFDESYGSIPVITIGRLFNHGERILLPLAVQVHHGLVDGLHVGRFFEQLRRLLDDPKALEA